MSGERVGVASIVQETNTFAVSASTLSDFEDQGLDMGEDAARHALGTNTELAGAIERIAALGATPVPIMRAWAMSGGRLERASLDALGAHLAHGLAQAGRLDGLVLSLHGALAAEGVDDADAWLLEVARATVGPDVPIAVCLDLHANVTRALIEGSDLLLGYLTYPHIDQASTGGRAAELLLGRLRGASMPRTALSKRPMLLPAETTQTTSGPMGALRRLADRLCVPPVLDISIFPVQPWLDVAELGFGVTVTADEGTDPQALADDIAALAWELRASFDVDLVAPAAAIARARSRAGSAPLLVSESADSPTAGAGGDSPQMLRALLTHGGGLRAYLTLVDTRAVATCVAAGVGAEVRLRVGASIDDRFHAPVDFAGRVDFLGTGEVRLSGPVFTGMAINMGRCAVVTQGTISVLLTERPAATFDPATFRSVGLDPAVADVIVVRSANLFRAGWADVTSEALILDLPGASTPRLDSLRFEHAPRPLFPVDRSHGPEAPT